MPGYIDFHCDTLMMFAHEPSADMIQNPNRMVDIDRLNRAGCAAQFFATFMPPVPAMEKRGMSDEDYRCWESDAFQMYMAMRSRGV
ncbi:MAG: hypothetical protein HUJ69_08490, partial [Lachnospiraceae bacterium]|nr:hypothetical protein [Lachnospiraceae bacterium]